MPDSISTDDFLKSQGVDQKKQSPEQFLGDKEIYDASAMGGEFFDAYFTNKEAGRVLDQFGQGFKEGWGTKQLGIDPETEKRLKTDGLFNDYEKGQHSLVREFNEAILRPLAVGVDLAVRAPYAAARGLAATETPLAISGAVVAAGMEAFPAGHLTGFPAALPPRTPLEQAHELGITDERFPGPTPNETVRQSFAPTAEPSRTQQVIADTIPERPTAPAETPGAPSAPLDIHQAARQIAPDTFATYDAFSQQKDTFRQQLEDLREKRDEVAMQPVNEILDKVRGAEERLSKKQSARLEIERAIANGIMGQDTAEMAAVRTAMMKADEGMRDLAPQVSEAYSRAREQVDAQVEPTPQERLAEATANPDAEVIQFPSRPQTASLEDLGLQTLAQRRPSIAQDVTQKLMQAGRSEEEATAAGQLWEAHYRARANRFGGALGAPTDLYYSEAPHVKYGLGAQRGRYSIVDNTITLFTNADASTFIHESGHNWLLEMQRDAAHEQAPQGLRDDMQAVRDWVGAEGDAALTRRQHEQFARGFERYMMEGTAPTARLARVFAQFRDWLTSIYQTVARLRAPINDQIRGVYDRLLSTPRDETIIAPEREVAANFADVHEADLKTSTPESAEARAEQVRAERDQIAQILTTEINNARRRARAAKQPRREAGGDATGTGVSESSVVGGGRVAAGEEPAAKPTAISPSGASFKAESEIPSGAREPFREGGGRLIDRAGNIRLENLNAPDEVDEIIRGAARYNSTDYEAGRRGVVTDGQLIDLAEALGRDATFLDRKKIGDAFTSEEILAARQLLVESATNVWNRMREVAEGGDPLEMAKAIERHSMIQGKVEQAQAEWGRAGRAFRALDEFNGSLEELDQLLKSESGRTLDQLYQLARYGSKMKDPAQVSGIIAKTNHPIQRGIVYWVTNSYISGTFTHTVYGVANNIRSMMMPQTALVQAGIGAARGVLGIGEVGDRVYAREFAAAWMGFARGIPEAIRPALDAFETGQQLPLPGQKTYANPFGTYTPPWPKAVTNVIGFPGKVVAGIHQFSRVVFYSQYLHRLATRQALSEGLEDLALASRITKLLADPPKEMMAEAADRADIDMFQRRGTFGNIVGATERLMDENLPIARAAFPFIKIGVEIERETWIKHTPLGFASKEVRNQLLMREGGAAFDEAAGKQVVGIGLLFGGMAAAASALSTGYGPTNPEQRKVWLLSHIPYSVTIGNVAIPMEGLGPPGKLLQFGADIWETSHFWDGKNGGDLAIAYTKAVERAVFDESFFRSAMSLGEAMNDPGRNAARYLEGIFRGFVPYSAALGQTTRHVLDPYSKTIEPGAAGIFDSIRSGIPYASYGVHNARDVFGEPIRARQDVVGAALTMDGPNTDRYSNDLTVKWLQAQQIGIGRLDRSIWGVRTTPEQYDDLERIAGRRTKQYLDAALSTLQQMPKGMAVKEVDRLIGLARKEARMTVAMQSTGSSNDLVTKAQEIKLQQLQ